MRKYLCACVVLVLALSIAACGGSTGPSKGTASNATASNGGAGSSKSYAELRWGEDAFAGPVDWKKNVFLAVAWIDDLAIQSLLEFEPSGKVKLGLASSAEHPSPTTYVYKIRSGVRFSDGKPLTVADVLYSLQSNITGKESVMKQYWADVASVSASGSSTVIIKLKRPQATWPKILAFTGQIIEKAAAEKVGEKALGTPGGLMIGTGPWKFDSYKPETSVQFSRNPYWKGPAPPASKVTMNLFKSESSASLALRAGAIDGMFTSAPKPYVNIPGARVQTAPGVSTTFIAMNTKLAPFSDVHVRRAIAYATDDPGMVKALYPAGYATENVTLLPDTEFDSLGTSSQVNAMLGALPKYDFDLTAAKRELAKSAHPHGFSMTIQTFGGATVEVGAAQILASDLAKIGVTAKVREMPPNEASAVFTTPGRVSVFIINYSGIYPDPEGVLSQMLLPSQIAPSGGGLNVASYKSTEVEKLMSEQSETPDPATRLHLFGKLLGIVGAEIPYRPLFTPDEFVPLSDKYVFPTFSPWTVIADPWALDVKLAA